MIEPMSMLFKNLRIETRFGAMPWAVGSLEVEEACALEVVTEVSECMMRAAVHRGIFGTTTTLFGF